MAAGARGNSGLFLLHGPGTDVSPGATVRVVPRAAELATSQVVHSVFGLARTAAFWPALVSR